MNTTSEQRCFGGTQGFYSHASTEIGGPMKFAVFLPPGAKHCPTLYYLAGLTCSEETFVIKAGAQRVAAELGLAIVTCDTSPRHARYPGDDASWDFGQSAGFYLDALAQPWCETYRMESYVVRELRALVEANFPVSKTQRGIFGHSMGGHGALTLALRNPGVYASLSAFAPITAPTRVPWGEKAFRGYLGADRTLWARHDACALVQERAFPGEILIDQGLGDKFLTRELQPENFVAACASGRQALHLEQHEGYDHSYYFIASFIEKHLRHHAQVLHKA
jgi:S-formylglutathione hydrolase